MIHLNLRWRSQRSNRVLFVYAIVSCTWVVRLSLIFFCVWYFRIPYEAVVHVFLNFGTQNLILRLQRFFVLSWVFKLAFSCKEWRIFPLFIVLNCFQSFIDFPNIVFTSFKTSCNILLLKTPLRIFYLMISTIIRLLIGEVLPYSN